MRSTGVSEHHQNNSLKVVIAFANFLGPDVTFHEIQKKGADHSIFGHKG